MEENCIQEPLLFPEQGSKPTSYPPELSRENILTINEFDLLSKKDNEPLNPDSTNPVRAHIIHDFLLEKYTPVEMSLMDGKILKDENGDPISQEDLALQVFEWEKQRSHTSYYGLNISEKIHQIEITIDKVPWFKKVEQIHEDEKVYYTLNYTGKKGLEYYTNYRKILKEVLEEQRVSRHSLENKPKVEYVPKELLGLYSLLSRKIKSSFKSEKAPYHNHATSWFLAQLIQKDPEIEISKNASKKIVKEAVEKNILIHSEWAVIKGRPEKLYKLNDDLRIPDGVSIPEEERSFLLRNGWIRSNDTQETITGLNIPEKE